MIGLLAFAESYRRYMDRYYRPETVRVPIAGYGIDSLMDLPRSWFPEEMQ